ncbi:MAG: hypothetical protein O3A95_10885 [Planctomycetota bacterium]|nr:hypothetical protein [Planctomycetota bacterium]MDA1114788.1 hypothetical protein [Planctomycetota bacterium]
MRQNMTFLLRFGIGVLLALAATNWLAERLDLRWNEVPNHSYLQVVDGFRASPNEVDVVFFGTSSMRNAVAPEALAHSLETQLGRPTEVWNLAMPGATPEIARFYARELFKQKRPRVFVLEAAPFLWDADRARHPDSEVYWRWFAGMRELVSESDRMRGRDVPEALHGLSWGVEALWMASGVMGKDFPEGEHHTAAFGGVYELEELPMPRRQKPVTEQEAVREKLRVGGYTTSEAWRKDLREIAALCKEKQVRLVLVHQPFYSGLLQHFEAGAYDEYMQWMQQNAEQLDLDFYNLHQDWELPMEHYRDFIHYAPQGAAWFSERLAQEILAPMLQD